MVKRQIIVKAKNAEKKVYAADSFFNAMHFGVGDSEGEKIYYKNYYLTLVDGDLFERHQTVLKSIRIKYIVETFPTRRFVKHVWDKIYN